jgi:protein TonB
MKGRSFAFSLAGAQTLPVTGDSHPLRREFSKWMTTANAVSLLVGGLVFGAWLYQMHREKMAPVEDRVKIVRYTELGVPPSISKPSTPQVQVQAVAPPSIGIPEPVPDSEAKQTTIATQAEMADALAPITMSDLAGGGNDSLIVRASDRSPGMDDFVAVEDQPVRLRIDPPQYPQLAREAGIEGRVMIRALIGKDGKVKKAVLIEAANQILVEAALASAHTAIFKPAMQQGKPVEVWVMMPIDFSLK